MAHVARPVAEVRSPPRVARPPLLAVTVLLAPLLLLAALAVPALCGRVFIADDLGAFHLPARAFYANALAQGERFDWWPQLYGGFYLTGEGQVGSYHPLHLLFYRLLPLPAAFDLEILLNYPLMLLGGFLWLRRRLPRADAALFGATLMTFSGFNLLHLAHVNAVAVVAHLPWLLLAIDVAVCDPRPRRSAAATAAVSLLTASQILLGYPQYVWYSLLAEAGYAWWLLHTWKNWSAGRSADRGACGVWLNLAAAVAVGTLIGGIQLLPTLDALSTSVRSRSGAEFAESGSLHPLNLLQLVAPYLFDTRVVGLNTRELGLYAGSVPLMLCAWLWIRRRELGPLRRPVTAAAGLGACGLILAAGRYGLVYRLQTWLPIVGKFRFPCRAIVLVHLSTAVLAAVALSVLASDQRPRRRISWRRFGPLWSVVGASLLAAAVAPLLWPEYVAAWPYVLAGPALLTAAAWLVWQADRGDRWALSALVLLAIFDLGWYGLSYSVRGRTAEFAEFAGRWNRPSAGAEPRLLAAAAESGTSGIHVGNQALLAGWSRIDGYAGLEPARTLDYCRAAAQRVAGVAWIGSSRATLKPVPNPLPAVRLLTQVQPTRDPLHDLDTIDPATTALVEPEFVARHPLPPGRPGTVNVIQAAPGRFELSVHCESPQLLAINQSWHAGWQATVDGRPARVWRINGDFLGCLVPAGVSRVTVDFRPASLRLGVLASCCGLGLWIAALCWTCSGTRIRTRNEEQRR